MSANAYEQLASSISDHALLALSVDAHVILWTDGAAAMTGYAREEILNRPYSLLFAGESLSENLPARRLSEAAAKGKCAATDWRVRKDGSLFQAEAVITAIYDNQRNVIGYSEICRDVTQQMRDLEISQEDAATVEALLESAAQAIIAIDEGGTINLANKTAELMFGYSREQLLGMPVEALLPERYAHQHSLHRSLFSAHPNNRPMGIGMDLYGRRNSGEEFPVEISLSSFKTRQGQNAVAFISDIAERKTKDAELAAHANELTRRADQLYRSNGDLERFAYVASHDLSEPLRSVASYSQLLASQYSAGTLTGEDAEEFILYIRSGVDRMHRLIQGLLSYSRVIHDDSTLFSIVDPAEIIHEVLESLESAIEQSEATIQVGHLDRVRSDRTQLGQIFQNLLGNALKYGPPGKRPVLKIESERRGTNAVFSIEDNGIGIAPDDYERIFTIFKRLHTEKEYPGLGIGLSLAKRLVERHGGKIWVESTVGAGSIFYFSMKGYDETDSDRRAIDERTNEPAA